MIIPVPANLGYVALFGFVFAESTGVPVPGETALVGAGLLAGSGHLVLPLVIAVGSVAAILGDNLGYWLGRRGGRTLLLRDGRFANHRRKAVAKSEEFFERHGPKAVFLGRWVTGVRVVAALTAGASGMPWRKFLIYNATGALAWAASTSGTAALLGPVAAGIIYGAGMVALAGTAGYGSIRAWRLRRRTAVAA